MAITTSLTVNGRRVETDVPPDAPLLYALRNDARTNAVRFGCGLGQCGACTVLMGGAPVRACAVSVARAKGSPIITLEGLGGGSGSAAGALHPVQQAFVDEQATQCGYCLPGWILTAVHLAATTPDADEPAMRAALRGLQCRCGAHLAMLRAVRRAMAGAR